MSRITYDEQKIMVRWAYGEFLIRQRTLVLYKGTLRYYTKGGTLSNEINILEWCSVARDWARKYLIGRRHE